MSGGIIAGIISGIRRRLEKKFEKIGAVSEEKAVKLEELKLDKQELNMFRRLLKKGIIKETPDGRYYWS